MSWPWFKNMYLAPVGAQITDEQMKSIPYPQAELGVHITYKTVQAGCLLGGLIVAPVYRLLSRHPDAVLKARRFRSIGVGGAVLGAVVGPAMTVAFCSKKKPTHDALYDRDYRLRHNQGQLNTDRLTSLGGLVGFGAAGPYGFVMGVNAGLLARGAYLLYDKYAGSPPPAAEEHDEPKVKVDKDDAAETKGNEVALMQTAAQLADEGPIVRADVLDNRSGVSPWLTKWKRTAPADEASAAPAAAAAVAPSEPKRQSDDGDQRREAATLVAVWLIGVAVLYGLATGK